MAHPQPTIDHAAQPKRSKPSLHAFQGFAPPTSNTTYTPNQFFDVVLPHASRGCVRLVGYLIRKTLGWCDAEGNPQEEQIRTPYTDLVAHAGISRDRIRAAIDEAIDRNLIRCVRSPRPSTAHASSVTGLCELRWDNAAAYVKDPTDFRGFFEGEGNRTDIPNQFFDEILPRESLAVIKVVGAVIRFSIGFQARRGRRRQQVALSYTAIQRYARIRSRSTLAAAVDHAVRSNYLVRVSEGVFTPDSGLQSSTTYALRWLDMSFYAPTGQKIEPEKSADFEAPDRSEKRTRTGPKSEPANRSEKRTTYKRNRENETSQTQQQRRSRGAVAAEHRASFKLLAEQGFSDRDAKRLAEAYPAKTIRDQVNWLERRNPARNRRGLLRRAIEENWEPPFTDEAKGVAPADSVAHAFAAHFYAGFHGSESTPVADPSANDLRHAERFLARLREPLPEKAEASEWGRALGRLHAEAQRDTRDVISCVVALRTHGDELLRRIDTDRERDRQLRVRQARDVHRQKHFPHYLAHLRRREAELQSKEPAAIVAFERRRAAERAQIERNPYYTPEQRRRELVAFESEERRLRDLRSSGLFPDLPSFETWDARLNPEPFRDEEARP